MNKLETRFDIHFFENTVDVLFQRVIGNEQQLRDVRIAVSLEYKPENLRFAFGKEILASDFFQVYILFLTV